VCVTPVCPQRFLPDHLSGASVEFAPYWADSFGNRTRLDYGTGHEATFMILIHW
jgi:hypothetical protein